MKARNPLWSSGANGPGDSCSTTSTGIVESDLHRNGPAVAIRQLDFAYAEGGQFKQVLFDINLEIWPGEIILLTGPSGCGKTTLLTLIGGLRTVQSGELVVLGY